MEFGIRSCNIASIGYSTGSVLAKSSTGYLAGIMVTAAATTPTLAVYDNNTRATGTVIMNTFTPVAGTMYWFGLPVKLYSGLYVYSSGSVICNIAYI
jgi:hypothetical protein